MRHVNITTVSLGSVSMVRVMNVVISQIMNFAANTGREMMDRQTLALMEVLHRENECLMELFIRYIYAMNPDVAERLVREMKKDWDNAFEQVKGVK